MYYVYILTNFENDVFYTGVTNDIERRTFEHNLKMKPNGFPERYNLNRLVYVEGFSQVVDAIAAEKYIKKTSRQRKRNLISEKNPRWENLFAE